MSSWAARLAIAALLLCASAPVGAQLDELDETDLFEREEALPLQPLEDSREGIPDAESPAPDPTMEEILIQGVAATQVAETTDSAIEFDADALRAEGISDIRDLANFTPNLEIKSAFAASNATLFIRGVGLDDDNANAASSVSVYQDGVYMNSPAGQLFQLFDVEGIEVLRGPQGTLRNASAGAILVRSRRPHPDFEAEFSATYGRFNEREFEGALNLPLSDQWAWRNAFQLSQRDGIATNRCNELAKRAVPREQRPCQPAVGNSIDKHVNDANNWAARSLLAGNFSLAGYEIDLLANVHGGRNDSDATQFQHRGWQGFDRTGKLRRGTDDFNYRDSDGNAFAGEYDFQGDERLSLFGGSLTAEAEFGDTLTLKSISAYEWHDRETLENTDAGPRDWLVTLFTDDAWQFSQETWLDWLWDESDARIGAMFLTQQLDAENDTSDFRGSELTFNQLFSQETYGVGVYAQAHWQLPELEGPGSFLARFALDVGARYSWERKDFEISSDLLVGNSGGVTSIPDTRVEESWHGWSGFGSLTYEIAEEDELYVKYSRGWKPGGFNGGSIFSSEPIEPVDRETVDSIEVGLRTSWLDNRLDVSLTGFRYWYNDLQVFVVKQQRQLLVPTLVNAERANVLGAEFELGAFPVEELELRFAAAWLDSEYEKFSTGFPRRIPGARPPGPFVESRVVDFSGNRLIASPVWSLTGWVQYSLSLQRFGVLRPRFSYSWKDEVFFGPNEGKGQRDNLPDGTLGQESHWVLNAALTWLSPNENIEVVGWVRNLLDAHYRVQSFDVTENSFRFTLDVFAQPRTYGVTLRLRF